MKKILALIAITFASTAFSAEIKEVCHDRLDKAGKPVMDKKTGKVAKDCKKIKVHKKLEGTPLPDPKKK